MKKHLFVFLVFLCPLLVFSQNVGVGTADPLMKLHVTSADSSVLLIENTQALGTGINTSMYFKTGNGTYPYTGGIKTIGTGTNFARLGLFTYAASSPNGLVERMSILDGGDVGIGLLSPSSKLEVEGGIKADSIDVSSGLIKNVADPVSAQDAATKAYVDLLEAKLDSLIAVLSPPAVGDCLVDGVVFYIFQSGDAGYVDGETHGLVVSLDQGFGGWGCFGTDLPAVPNVSSNPTDPETVAGARIGDGETNTDGIVQDCPSGYAADWCRDKGPEWFLPSRGELNELYKWYVTDKPGNDNLMVNCGGVGFAADWYWSSTEDDDIFAWKQDFSVGFQFNNGKTSSYLVRAVRAF